MKRSPCNYAQGSFCLIFFSLHHHIRPTPEFVLIGKGVGGGAALGEAHALVTFFRTLIDGEHVELHCLGAEHLEAVFCSEAYHIPAAALATLRGVDQHKCEHCFLCVIPERAADEPDRLALVRDRRERKVALLSEHL